MKFNHNEMVKTPNGPGLINGKMEIDGIMWGIVAHKPNTVNPQSEKGVRISKWGIVWDLWRYPLDTLSKIDKEDKGENKHKSSGV